MVFLCRDMTYGKYISLSKHKSPGLPAFEPGLVFLQLFGEPKPLAAAEVVAE